jgi:hypothetical protein
MTPAPIWLQVLAMGGAAAVAAVCIFLAVQKEARGPFKWFLWILAIVLLLIQAGCWIY